MLTACSLRNLVRCSGRATFFPTHVRISEQQIYVLLVPLCKHYLTPPPLSWYSGEKCIAFCEVGTKDILPFFSRMRLLTGIFGENKPLNRGWSRGEKATWFVQNKLFLKVYCAVGFNIVCRYARMLVNQYNLEYQVDASIVYYTLYNLFTLY
jgi:hypothetical protein